MVLSQLSKIEINRRGFIDPQRQGGSGGGRRNIIIIFLSRAPRSLRSARVLANVFEKNEKKNKTTSVYRLYIYRVLLGISFGRLLLSAKRCIFSPSHDPSRFTW